MSSPVNIHLLGHPCPVRKPYLFFFSTAYPRVSSWVCIIPEDDSLIWYRYFTNRFAIQTVHLRLVLGMILFFGFSTTKQYMRHCFRPHKLVPHICQCFLWHTGLLGSTVDESPYFLLTPIVSYQLRHQSVQNKFLHIVPITHVGLFLFLFPFRTLINILTEWQFWIHELKMSLSSHYPLLVWLAEMWSVTLFKTLETATFFLQIIHSFQPSHSLSSIVVFTVMVFFAEHVSASVLHIIRKEIICCRHTNPYQAFCFRFHTKVSFHMELILSQGDSLFAFYFILQEKQLLIKSAEYTCLILLAGLTVVLNHALIVCSGRDDSTGGNWNASYLSPVIPRNYRDHSCDTSQSYNCTGWPWLSTHFVPQETEVHRNRIQSVILLFKNCFAGPQLPFHNSYQ